MLATMTEIVGMVRTVNDLAQKNSGIKNSRREFTPGSGQSRLAQIAHCQCWLVCLRAFLGVHPLRVPIFRFLAQKIPPDCKLESTDAFRLKQAASRPIPSVAWPCYGIASKRTKAAAMRIAGFGLFRQTE